MANAVMDEQQGEAQGAGASEGVRGTSGPQALPMGHWDLDPTHSSAEFAVRHAGVSVFRGRFTGIEGGLDVDEDGGAELWGQVDVASLHVVDEQQQAHLRSPDFFDLERSPLIEFRSGPIQGEGRTVMVEGQLTIKGQARTVAARGQWSGPVDGGHGLRRLGLSLEATVDRHDFGLGMDMELSPGVPAIGADVVLTVELELTSPGAGV